MLGELGDARLLMPVLVEISNDACDALVVVHAAIVVSWAFPAHPILAMGEDCGRRP